MTKNTRTYLLQILLFIVTVVSTTYVGAEWTGDTTLQGWSWFWSGLNYSIALLTILSIHEFGHYICARRYGVQTSWPYYIPLPLSGSFGTFGAVILKKEREPSKRVMFDIGIAGPLAGFVAAVAILAYGFTHLPDKEYIYNMHADYKEYNGEYAKHVYTYQYMRKEDSLYHEKLMHNDSLKFIAAQKETKKDAAQWHRKAFEAQKSYYIMGVGSNILFKVMSEVFVNDESLMPNSFEVMHYPLLFAGYIALFFTAINLLPIGQLDGGHVIYGLFGFRRHRIISLSAFTLLVLVGGVGIFRSNLLGIDFFNADPVNMLLFAGAYLYFLFSMYERFFKDNKTTAVLVATCIFTAQFLTEYLFPSWQGFSGWMMIFAYLLGRFLGLEHPPAAIEEPLNWKRKVLGWLALLIFVLCFTPEVFTIQVLTP